MIGTILFLIAIISCFITYGYGFDRGRKYGMKGRAQYLEARINGAKTGIVPLAIVDYEEHAFLTVTSECYGSPDWFAHITAKLAGETGEFMEHYGKAICDDDWSPFKDGVAKLSAERRLNLLKELGDIAWYIVVIAKELGSNFTEVLLLNISKRESRRQRGKIKGSGDDR